MQNGPDSSIYVNPDNGGLLMQLICRIDKDLIVSIKSTDLTLQIVGTSVSRFNNLIVIE